MTNEKQPITEKQRQARRENGKKGKGPKSAEGKANSAKNAVKHGYWAGPLYAISVGPFREDPAALEAYVDAFVTELRPGDSVVLREAALDVANKGWRVSRAQRFEADGYAGADYAAEKVRYVAVQREVATRCRREADVIRGLPAVNASEDEIFDAFLSLCISVGVDDEELAWTDDADLSQIVQAMSELIAEHFADNDDAASTVEERAAECEARADAIESVVRRDIVRTEMDGSFARNAERMVAHASREYDRSLKRYWQLFERYGKPGVNPDDQDSSKEARDSADGSASRVSVSDDRARQAEVPPQETQNSGIWADITADRAIDLLLNGTANNGAEPPPRNEPTEGNPIM